VLAAGSEECFSPTSSRLKIVPCFPGFRSATASGWQISCMRFFQKFFRWDPGIEGVFILDPRISSRPDAVSLSFFLPPLPFDWLAGISECFFPKPRSICPDLYPQMRRAVGVLASNVPLSSELSRHGRPFLMSKDPALRFEITTNICPRNRFFF